MIDFDFSIYYVYDLKELMNRKKSETDSDLD
jgi:hypothetical protein